MSDVVEWPKYTIFSCQYYCKDEMSNITIDVAPKIFEITIKHLRNLDKLPRIGVQSSYNDLLARQS